MLGVNIRLSKYVSGLSRRDVRTLITIFWLDTILFIDIWFYWKGRVRLYVLCVMRKRKLLAYTSLEEWNISNDHYVSSCELKREHRATLLRFAKTCKSPPECSLSSFPPERLPAHCLNHLYTVKRRPPGAMRLRTGGHQFELPAVKYEFNKRNFIVRSLFNYVWFVCFHLYCLHFFVFRCTHVRMSYVLNSYLLTYLHPLTRQLWLITRLNAFILI